MKRQAPAAEIACEHTAALSFLAGTGSKGGVLLIHGLTACPKEMSELGEFLAGKGFNAFAPCLSGHASSIAELRTVPASQWVDDVVKAFESFSAQSTSPLSVVGQSFGAILALYLAERFPRRVRAVVCLAPPLSLGVFWKKIVAGLLSYAPDGILNRLGFSDKQGLPITPLALEHHAYSMHAKGAVARMMYLARIVRNGLRKIEAPVLVVLDPADYHVSNHVPEILQQGATRAAVRCLWLPGGHHVLTKGKLYLEVYQQVEEFLSAHV